VTVHTS